MWKVLKVIGVLLVASELISYVSIWPSLYDFTPMYYVADEPYMKVVPGDGPDYYGFFPLLIGIIFIVVGEAKSREI